MDTELDYLPARIILETAAAVVPHPDADGLAAGAIALRARGDDASAALLLGRGETPFTSPLPPGRTAVLDWGVRNLDRPALFVDHHAPEATGLRADQVVVSGYGSMPELTTAPLMRRLVPEAPPWLAAVGAYGDLGYAAFALPECHGAPRALVRELTPLVNAPRRIPDGPVREALAVLVEAETPRAALDDPRTRDLADCRDEWQSALRAVLRTAPVVRGGAALVRFATPYQLHPVVAATWARRLAPRLVVAANEGYLPDRVNFAVRGGRGDLRRVLLRALPAVSGEFAHGHDRATGGSLAPVEFDRLLAALELA